MDNLTRQDRTGIIGVKWDKSAMWQVRGRLIVYRNQVRCGFVATDQSSSEEAAWHTKRNNEKVAKDAFLPTVIIIIIIIITSLASLFLFAVAVYRRHGGALQSPCSRATKVQQGGIPAETVADGGQSARLLPRSFYDESKKMNKPSQSSINRTLLAPRTETVDDRHHPSAVQEPRHLGALSYRPPIWALSPPPPPPPSSAVDDVFSEYAEFLEDDDDVDDGDQLRTAGRSTADSEKHSS